MLKKLKDGFRQTRIGWIDAEIDRLFPIKEQLAWMLAFVLFLALVFILGRSSVPTQCCRSASCPMCGNGGVK